MNRRNERFLDFLCRTCMQELVEASSDVGNTKPKLQWESIFGAFGESESLHIAELLSSAVPQIEVQRSDELPKKICHKCLEQLQSIHKFQQMCVQSQQQILQLIHKTDADHGTNIDKEKGQKIEFASVETLPDAMLSTVVADPLQSINKVKVENCKDTEAEFGIYVINDLCNDNEPNVEQSDSETLLSTVTIKNEAVEVETEIETGGKGKSSLSSPPYICTICDKSFNKSRYLKCHLKRHKEGNSKKLEKPKPISSPNSKGKTNLKSVIAERSPENEKNTNDEFSLLQEYLLDSKELVSVTNLPEAPTTSGDNPTESNGAPIDTSSPNDVDSNAKYEACDNDVSSDDEILLSSFTTKKDALPVTEKKKSNSASSPHICSKCNKSFDQPSYLRRHLRRHEAKDEKKLQKQNKVKQEPLRKYQCKFCDKCYQKSTSLRNHVRTHTGERPFLCPECGKSFTASNNLLNHLSRHTDVKAYECPLCPKKFRCKSNLSSHRKTHDAVKSHICDICGHACMQAGMLRKHKQIHSGERPFKCDFCEKRFVRACQRRTHARIHTGEKPYKCKYCECAYLQGSELTKHLRFHLGDNIYRCEFCPLAFRLVAERNLHVIEHKNEDPETHERNMKALNEANAKLQLKLAETICNQCNKSRCQ